MNNNKTAIHAPYTALMEISTSMLSNSYDAQVAIVSEELMKLDAPKRKKMLDIFINFALGRASDAEIKQAEQFVKAALIIFQ